MVLKTQCWLCLPGPRAGPATTGLRNGLWGVGQSSFWAPLERGTNSVVSGRDILMEGCSEVGLGVCSHLEAAGCISLGIPAPIFFRRFLFPCPATTNQPGREAPSGLELSRSVSSLLEVVRVISGEPGGVYHLPWELAGFTLHPNSTSFRVCLWRL